MAIEPLSSDESILQQLFPNMELLAVQSCGADCCRFYLAIHPNGARFLLVIGNGRNEGHNLLLDRGQNPESVFAERVAQYRHSHHCASCQTCGQTDGDVHGQDVRRLTQASVPVPLLATAELAVLSSDPNPQNLAMPDAP